MEEKNFILENEYDVNRVMLKMFRILIYMIPFITLFKVLKLFIVPWSVVIVLCVAVIVASLVPLLLFRHERNRHIKLYSVVCVLTLSTIIYSFVFVNGIFFMIVPSLIALLYFDVKLLKIATFSTIPLMVVGELFASYGGQKFLASTQWIPIHIVVFSMQFAVIFMLLLNLTTRAKKMLNDTKNMFDEMSVLYKNIYSSSEGVTNDIGILNENFSETAKLSKEIETFISHISEKTELFNEEIKIVVTDSEDMTTDIEKVYEIISYMKNETEKTSIELGDNLKSIIQIVEQFRFISSSTESSKSSVTKLFDEIKEIHKAIELTEKIQKQTSLLSINASIEASRIGEAGKGFKVVADGIKNLAIQSSDYIDVIKKQINMVETNAKETVQQIQGTYTIVETGMANISVLESFFDFIKSTLINTKTRIDEVNDKMNKLEAKEKNINQKIKYMNESNGDIVKNIYNISGNIEELVATFDTNNNLLKNIETKSKELIEN